MIKKNGREQEQMKIVDMWIMNKWWGTRGWTGRRLKGQRLGTSDDDYNMTMKMWMGNEQRGIYNDWENDWRNKNMEQLNEGIAGQVIKTGRWWGGKVIEDLGRLIFDMIWWGICARKWWICVYEKMWRKCVKVFLLGCICADILAQINGLLIGVY